MLVYFVIFLIPVLYSFARPRFGAGRDVSLATYFIILLLFTGLRDHVGADWSGYQNIFAGYYDQPVSNAFSNHEPGFFLINKLSQSLGWDLYGVNFICAAIFLSGVFMYARSTANAWLAIAAVTPFLVFIISMSGIRQSAAIGIGLLAFSRWDRSSLLYKVGMVAVATSFHNSAVLLAIFVVLRFDRFLWLRLIAAVAIAAVAANAAPDAESFVRYQRVYVQENLRSSGAFYHLMLSAFPASLYLFFRRQIAAHGGRNALVDVAAWMILLAIPLILVSSTGVSRAALYLSFLQMWIYPVFSAAHGSRRIAATLFCAAIFNAIFFVYFMAGSFAYTYIPYRTILFE